ncbi:MAG: DNA gyrase modulator [Geminicoccaceae bacterium]
MDDGELFLERRHEEQLTFEDGRLRVADRELRQGFGLRAVAGERVGLPPAASLGSRCDRRGGGRPARGSAAGHAGRDNPLPPTHGDQLYAPDDPIRASAGDKRSLCSPGSRPMCVRKRPRPSA